MKKAKTMLLGFLLALLLTTSLSAAIGDVNGDSSIDIVDALMTAQYYVGLSVSGFDVAAADINSDGAVNIVDALMMAQIYVGLIDPPTTPTNPPVLTPPPGTTFTIQAEDGSWNNAAIETEHSGYTGSGYVNTANESGTYLEWGFNLSAAGNAQVVFTYANGGDSSRTMSVSVNGSTVVSSLVFPTTGAWDSWSTVSSSVYLSAGDNTLRITSQDSEGAPNIDKVDITAGGSIQPTVPPTAPPTPSEGPSPPPGSYSGPVGWGRNTTGGQGGSTINVSTYSQLESAVSGSSPAIVVIQNDIYAGEGMMDVDGNKTIRGAGSGVHLDFGFYLHGSNVIIQNLDMMNGGFNEGDSEGLDCVTWASDLQNVWVDHCTLHEAMDGLVDPTRNARFVTISFCYLYHQKTAVLIGASDSDSDAQSAQSNSDKSQWAYTVTMHHCWFDDVYERCPRVRYGAVHMFNNYIGNCPSYAVGVGVSANIYSENNYYYNTNEVWHKWDSSSKPGYVEDVGSLFEGDNGSIADYPPPANWAWNPASYYSYSPHSAQWVKANLQNYAGMGKGNP